MIAAAFLTIALAAAPPPTYLVERVLTVGGEVRRISVFRGGIVVLARTRAGEKKHVLQQTLTTIELEVLGQVVAECYPELARFATVGEAPGEASIELRLAPPDHDPLTVRLPFAGVPTVGMARLSHALDELEGRLARDTVAREDLREWRPKVGEWLELDDGRLVTIIEILETTDKQVVRVQIGEGPASLFMSEEELRRRAVRRVAR